MPYPLGHKRMHTFNKTIVKTQLEETIDPYQELEDMIGSSNRTQAIKGWCENRQKEGQGFYKMDDNSIQMVRECLTEDFHALAKSHTKAIGWLLKEFNDD